MAIVAAFLPNAVHLQRLRNAIRDRHEVLGCETWSSLIDACVSHAVRVVVLDLFDGGSANFEHVRQLKQRVSRLTVIAYVTFTGYQIHDLFDAGRQGVDGLIVADQDDLPRALLANIEQAEARSLGATVRHALDTADPTVRDAVLLTVTRAHERLTPDQMGRLLALPRRTMTQRLADAGYPAPQQLITWGRLIVAAHLLEDPHRSADRVAMAMEFPSASAFRNSCQRYLGATPSDIRERGGAGFVIARLFASVGKLSSEASAAD